MFRKLLVPLDRSPLAEQALAPAAAIAEASGASLDLVVVHRPLPVGGFSDVPWSDDEEGNYDQSYLDAAAATLASRTGSPVTHAVVRGSAVEMICRRAREGDADLVVLTSHGRTGLSRFWLGSVANGVLRRSTIPVLMLRPVATDTNAKANERLFPRLLVPLDGSAFSLEVLSAASDLARCGGSRIVLLRVVHPVPTITGVPFTKSTPAEDTAATARLADEAKRELAGVARMLAGEGIETIESHVVVAEHVAPAIIDFAADHGVDAIAMSTHGRGASPFAMGSVADKVLRASGVPLLLRRPVAVGAEPPLVDAASIAQQLPALANA